MVFRHLAHRFLWREYQSYFCFAHHSLAMKSAYKKTRRRSSLEKLFLIRGVDMLSWKETGKESPAG